RTATRLPGLAAIGFGLLLLRSKRRSGTQHVIAVHGKIGRLARAKRKSGGYGRFLGSRGSSRRLRRCRGIGCVSMIHRPRTLLLSRRSRDTGRNEEQHSCNGAHFYLPAGKSLIACCTLQVLRLRKTGCLTQAQRDASNCNEHCFRVRFRSGGAFGSAAHALSGPTLTSCLPKLAPLRSPMNAAGALSRPSVTNSRCLTLPSRTHCDMSRKKSA